mmetsp:Transcript_16837/g.25314  ORF Transcript_16837/g.25314 Transcript_16837/m.25314 type:complete len:235 (-) Transcript_16837:343-1047(-)
MDAGPEPRLATGVVPSPSLLSLPTLAINSSGALLLTPSLSSSLFSSFSFQILSLVFFLIGYLMLSSQIFELFIFSSCLLLLSFVNCSTSSSKEPISSSSKGSIISSLITLRSELPLSLLELLLLLLLPLYENGGENSPVCILPTKDAPIPMDTIRAEISPMMTAPGATMRVSQCASPTSLPQTSTVETHFTSACNSPSVPIFTNVGVRGVDDDGDDDDVPGSSSSFASIMDRCA